MNFKNLKLLNNPRRLCFMSFVKIQACVLVISLFSTSGQAEQNVAQTEQINAPTQVASTTNYINKPNTPALNLNKLSTTQEIDLNLPRILSEKDAELYDQIFSLQVDGKWRAARKLIKKLENPILMGHVDFQRYMHPTAYRSKYTELKQWMKNYSDHPGAGRVYNLAVKRRPANYKYPLRPRNPDLPGFDGTEEEAKQPQAYKPVPRIKKAYRNRKIRNEIRQTQRSIKRLVQRGSVTISLERLKNKRNQKIFDNVSFAESLGVIARGYYRYHKDKEAITVALEAIKKSPKVADNARWWGGLAAWRSKDYAAATKLFSGLADGKYTPYETRAAGAYWASRAYLQGGWPARVNDMLEKASRYKHTFYGLIAAYALGKDPGFNWKIDGVEQADIDLLLRIPAAKRALALIEANQSHRAETELRRFVANIPASLKGAILAFADSAGLADLSYRLGREIERKQGGNVDAAIYPVPSWTPKDGFQLDRALIYAFVRQESRFRPRAKSYAGARGLMQLMPATAGFIAKRRFSGASRDKLYVPDYNLMLGQKYLQHLLEDFSDGGNLFQMAAAYNGGPGNLQKWMRKVDFQNDPLLFIESLPSRETRNYIEHVFSNLWIYRHRLGQHVPTLDAILTGNWPIYIGLDRQENFATTITLEQQGSLSTQREIN